VFSWTSRRRDASPPEAPSPAPRVDENLATSKVLPRLLASLLQAPTPVLLDLGPVVGANVSFFGDRLACKIYIEDLFADIERHARAGTRETLPQTLALRSLPAEGSVDAILCWDLFDYLEQGTGKALAARLTGLLRTGGVLYGFFGTTPVDLAHYTRFALEGEETLRQRQYPATVFRRTVLTTRDINRMFEGLVVAESVLLKSSTRETLFRKP
jgi:hypothetical protein